MIVYRKHWPVVVALFAVAAVALALEETTPKSAAQPEFEKFKALAGTWVGTATHDGDESHPATVKYLVTAGGSAIFETLFEGTEQEMVTVYHLDGDKLMLTNYCVLGNQPRMTASKSKTPNKLAFEFGGGTNMKSDDPHMHRATFKFVSDDHIQSTWVMYENGKPQKRAVLDLRRQAEAIGQAGQ